MRRVLAGIAVLGFLITPALADPQTVELLNLMRKLDATINAKSSGAVTGVSFVGDFAFTTTINIQSAISVSIFCRYTLFILGSDGSSYSASSEVPVMRSGNRGKCAGTVHMRAADANPAGSVFLTVAGSTADSTVTFTDSPPPLPLPPS